CCAARSICKRQAFTPPARRRFRTTRSFWKRFLLAKLLDTNCIVSSRRCDECEQLCNSRSVEYVWDMNAKILMMTVVAVAMGGLVARAQDQPMSVADVKALAKAEVSDEVILSQIRNTHSAFHLSTAEILDLKDAGVSQKVIDFMINSPSVVGSAPSDYT